MYEDWLKTSACGLGRRIGANEIDPVELTEAFLAAIESNPDSKTIYARVTAERARSEARNALERTKRGARLSLLDGVPISWKDLFDTEGVATEAGSALLKGRVPERDAEALRIASSSGMVCLGKTHMTEFAFSGLGVNPVTATPPCVNDPALAPGGSSSGAATSVAFGLAGAGLGSDTGGSVRLPAAWNDLVGLKPTRGVLPMAGVVPLCRQFDTIGPLTRTVEDAEAIFRLLAGKELPGPGVPKDMPGVRLLILETVAMEDLRPEPAEAFEAAVTKLQEAGVAFETVRIPAASEASMISGVLYTVEAYATWMDVIERAPDLMFEDVLARFRLGARHSGVEYVRAANRLAELRLAYLAAVEDYDAVAIPTSPILPPERERLLADGKYFATENLLALRNTRIGNLMEVPALTVPTGTPSTGLMLMGKPYEEGRLLELGRAVEKILA